MCWGGGWCDNPCLQQKQWNPSAHKFSLSPSPEVAWAPFTGGLDKMEKVQEHGVGNILISLFFVFFSVVVAVVVTVG